MHEKGSIERISPEIILTILSKIMLDMDGVRFIDERYDHRWTVVLRHPHAIQNYNTSCPTIFFRGSVHFLQRFQWIAYGLDLIWEGKGAYAAEVKKRFFQMTLTFMDTSGLDQFLRNPARAELIQNFCAPLTRCTMNLNKYGVPDVAMVDVFSHIHRAQSTLKNFAFKMRSGKFMFLGLLRFDGNMVYIYIDRQSFHRNALRPKPLEGFPSVAEFNKYMAHKDEEDRRAGVVRGLIQQVDCLIWQRAWSPDYETPKPKSEAEAIHKEIERITCTPTPDVAVWFRNMGEFPANT